jgi:NAD(P)-dependent dehydrogenase (short-subunit alcohol dehydrogenase family)
MSQAVARQMVKQRAGVIVNVSSESGLEGSEGQSCYAATKAALNSFTRSWSKSWETRYPRRGRCAGHPRKNRAAHAGI